MNTIRCSGCMKEIDSDVCPYCGFDNKHTEQKFFTLKLNTILKGRYLVGSVMGQGGFGITYVGYDLLLDVKVAVKEYFPSGSASRNNTVSNTVYKNFIQKDGDKIWEEGKESFLREARKMAKLKEIPQVVRVIDTFFENETAYIIMDFVEGETLKDYIEKNGTIKIKPCIEWFAPLMEGLRYIHDEGIIHRDISPDNIMVKKDNTLCILDLGAAKDISANKLNQSQIVAKEGYSPMEQYTSSGSIGSWTDVYALCATMLYTIGGKRLSASPDRIYDEELNLGEYVSGKLPGYAVKAFKRGLAVRPENRTQNMQELIKDFRAESKSKKWMLAILPLAAGIILAAFGIASMTKETTSSFEFAYTVLENRDGNTYISIDGYLGDSSETVIIPEKYDGGIVCEISDNAFESHKEIISVVIPEGIVSIGDSSFSDCINMEEIVLPQSLESIGEEAFYNCEDLESIVLPEGIKSIGVNAFRECKVLSEIIIPEGVETVNRAVFFGCYELSKVTFSEGVKTISGNAFCKCYGLKEITILGSAEYIDEDAFEDCDAVSVINCSEEVYNNFSSLQNLAEETEAEVNFI